MRSRFVRPDTAILELSDGDTLTVKKRLTSGEQRAAFDRASVPSADGTPILLRQKSWVAMITAYLLDWSFCDEAGKRVEIAGKPVDDVIAALDALDIESFFEVKEAIDAHEARMLAEREQEKNGQGNATGSPVISPLPDAVTGATSGSLT